MTSIPTRLSNCYVPIHLNTNDQSKAVRDSGDGTSRSDHQLRRLLLQTGILKSAAGSSQVEIGHTKVICKVFGPLTASSDLLPSSVNLNMDTGVLHVEVRYSPQIGYPLEKLQGNTVSSMDQSTVSSGKMSSWIMSREIDLSSKISSALAAAVPLQQYPKCALVAQLNVLQDDGSVLAACITALSLALVNAGVEVYDVVTACSVIARNDSTLLADPSLSEEEEGCKASMTLAMLPNWKEITFLEQSGRLSAESVNHAMELCRNGCRTMHRFMREHLIEHCAEED